MVTLIHRPDGPLADGAVQLSSTAPVLSGGRIGVVKANTTTARTTKRAGTKVKIAAMTHMKMTHHFVLTGSTHM